MQDLKFTTAGEYMNQSLLQLKQQAGIADNPDQEGLDLFAKLIVEECIDVVNKRYMGDNNREDMEVLRCVKNLKKHFGV